MLGMAVSGCGRRVVNSKQAPLARLFRASAGMNSTCIVHGHDRRTCSLCVNREKGCFGDFFRAGVARTKKASLFAALAGVIEWITRTTRWSNYGAQYVEIECNDTEF